MTILVKNRTYEDSFSYLYSVPFNLLFTINILVYVYKYFYSIKGNKKTKSLVIYGAGLQLQREFLSSEYKLIDEILHHRSISIFSREKL